MAAEKEPQKGDVKVENEGSLAFVHSTGAQGTSDSARKVIRRHVMKNYFKQKGEGGTTSLSLRISARTSLSSEKELRGRFKLEKVKVAVSGTCETEDGRPCASGGRKREGHEGQSTGAGGAASAAPDNVTEANPSSSSSASTIKGPQNEQQSQSLTLNVTHQIEWFHAHSSDPFDSLPVLQAQSPRLDLLLHFYRTVFNLNSIAVNPSNTWMSRCLNDHSGGLLHATLCSVSVYCELFHNLKTSQDVYYHKGEALKAITLRLSVEKETVSDTLLLLITTVASFENLLGHYDTAASHLTAIRRIVTLRGGPQALAGNDIVRGLGWAENHFSAAHRTLPVHQYLPISPTLSYPPALLVHAAASTPNCLLNLSLNGPQVFNIYYRIQQIGLAASSQWLPTVNRVVIADALLAVEYLVLRMDARDEGSGEGFVQGGVDVDLELDVIDADAKAVVEALMAAAQIFLYAGIRLVPIVLRIYSLLVSRLRDALGQLRLWEVWERECGGRPLLWVLFMGCLAGQKRGPWQWFVAQSASVAETLGLETPEDYKELLKTIAWTDHGMFDEVAEHVWTCMAELRRRDSGVGGLEVVQGLLY
ncbi:hypothetical protein K402DRAFT_344394 [Aulographum hederae CBS 113979]|uniref:Transcription factor domain-containing protein n=1 Tax=Aulographum hederae CBS 113979 TaxID=1176131 RepID=A0A6G1HH21_9PEZI|nr:hypothetical protein K402DRAFT_344394 [Aulographum hederae CBS 113979]